MLTFWGAAQMVTGSMHLLEAGNTRVLLDCGLYQGKRDEAHRRNKTFPFPPEEIDAVLVSHAHIDHCGNLPSLIHQGFDGPIYLSAATRDLLRVMLYDSAKIQEEDAAHLNIQRNYQEPFVQPLYTAKDVDLVLRQCVTVKFNETRDLAKNVRFQLIEAGHVLGSAMVHLTLAGENGERSITFTGDLGRRNLPLLRTSGAIPPADVLVCESTYGNRVHEPIENTVSKLYSSINRAIERGGKVLIPAFSLGRTQLIIHYLHEGVRQKKIPRIPVFVDSPLAADITEVYERHPECLTDQAQQSLLDGTGILGGDIVEYIREFEDSIQVSLRPDPCVVIASSGMCDAGRIIHHLKRHVDDPRCMVILVSYQAQGTTGRRLLEKSPTVRIQGRDWNKWLEVVHLDGFSGHADQIDFQQYLSPLAGKVPHARLIHGEQEQAEALARMMRGMGFPDVSVPTPGEKIVLE
ncbi:MBL fold metallo-hydrolase [Telmatocola sphagniphila]|uniref:MBL fold metallo-hydrolase n=1 Tax=Telmatocola sphagniphila TaxID=1123043 RepID=UPI001FED2411|nr:MBL fold metallo-hydrolase [Telmatocola sphagniphila]